MHDYQDDLSVKIGDSIVRRAMRVRSLVGATLEKLEAPCGGVICVSRTYVTVNQGDVSAQIVMV